uniref:Uncharacterized protein n=1 Tax=Romanomermis culicivorax TaxID=13658 RepID=A0A915KQ39_ROMCU
MTSTKSIVYSQVSDSQVRANSQLGDCERAIEIKSSRRKQIDDINNLKMQTVRQCCQVVAVKNPNFSTKKPQKEAQQKAYKIQKFKI